MKNKWIWIGIIIVVIIGVGGKIYMDKKEMEKQALLTIQDDLANYLYNNYSLYTFDKEKDNLEKEYNGGESKMSYDDYSKKLDDIAIYSDIEKVEFTGLEIGPMKGLVVNFVINDVYLDKTTLSTVSADTDKFIYYFDSGNDRNGYILEKRSTPTSLKLPKEGLVYYNGGIE